MKVKTIIQQYDSLKNEPTVTAQIQNKPRNRRRRMKKPIPHSILQNSISSYLQSSHSINQIVLLQFDGSRPILYIWVHTFSTLRQFFHTFKIKQDKERELQRLLYHHFWGKVYTLTILPISSDSKFLHSSSAWFFDIFWEWSTILTWHWQMVQEIHLF